MLNAFNNSIEMCVAKTYVVTHEILSNLFQWIYMSHTSLLHFSSWSSVWSLICIPHIVYLFYSSHIVLCPR